MANTLEISKRHLLLAGIALCALLIPLMWLAVTRLEGEPPAFLLEKPTHYVGTSYTLKGSASDRKSGVKRVWIAILQKGKQIVLLDKTFSSRGFLTGGEAQDQPVDLQIKVLKLGLADGEAILRTAVWDHSWRGWWAGNRSYAEHKLLIDTHPPRVEMLTRNHNLNQGGAGLAVYRVSEPVPTCGIEVADRFFPGSSAKLGASTVFVAFFALPYDKGAETRLSITATDRSGNISRTEFLHHINPKAFKKDALNVSDAFIESKILEFDQDLGSLNSSASLLEKFLAVNQQLRRANDKTIKDTCKQSDDKMLWNGPFLRLPASARKAGFGEDRTYKYAGRAVDQQVHLGIDLASTAHSPVPAANSGRVAFSANLGIYGKTVIIDHGLGLFSMYGHLSRIQVAENQMVAKGDVIGITGKSGLAGGDHLHFAMLIHGTFVNPIEWWDRRWIKHNITDKLKRAGKQIQKGG